MSTRLKPKGDIDKQKDKGSIEQIAFLMETEADRLVERKEDTWVSDITAHSFGVQRLRHSQFLRAIAVVMRSFINLYMKK